VATALIRFTQDTLGNSGEAYLGRSGSLVGISNVDNVGVLSWEIRLLDVDPASSLVVGILASGNTATPAASFTPDVAGCYRIQLELVTSSGILKDIRNFAVPTGRGYILPPYQKFPDPLPIQGSGYPGEKPDELNFSGQARGWHGGPTSGLMAQLIAKHDDLNSTIVSTVSSNIGVDSAAIHIFDMSTIGSVASTVLPAAPREGQQVRLFVKGEASTRLTVTAAAGSTLSPLTSLSVMGGSTATFTYISGTWYAQGIRRDIYERTIVGGLESTQEVGFTSVGTTHLDLGDLVNVTRVQFQAIIETSGSSDPAEIRLFNITTGSLVANSLLSTTGTLATLVSTDIVLPGGLNIYEAQLRVGVASTTSRVSCKQAQLLIDWVQL